MRSLRQLPTYKSVCSLFFMLLFLSLLFSCILIVVRLYSKVAPLPSAASKHLTINFSPLTCHMYGIIFLCPRRPQSISQLIISTVSLGYFMLRSLCRLLIKLRQQTFISTLSVLSASTADGMQLKITGEISFLFVFLVEIYKTFATERVSCLLIESLNFASFLTDIIMLVYKVNES